MTAELTCPAGRPIPALYVERAARTAAKAPLLVVAAALRDYETDHSRPIGEIAAQYGASYGTLRHWAKVAGLPRRSKANFTGRVGEGELLRTVGLVEQLGTRAAAARVLGLHHTSVRDRLRSVGHIEPRSAA